jgi:hypothetical protein
VNTAKAPVLGLALGGTGGDLVPLLAALRRWCDPQSLPRAGRPVAVLTDGMPTSQSHPTLTAGVPYAVASRDREVLAGAGGRAVYPPDGASARGARYLPPFVRDRLRAERRLPAAVLRPDRQWPGRGVVPEELMETAVACAAVVVADTPELAERAMAWGTPLVCDTATAAALDLTDGVDVLVDADPQTIIRAAALAARLSWCGRRSWERRHDAEHAAATLACWLLPSAPDVGLRQLAALGTPAQSAIIQRLRNAALC